MLVRNNVSKAAAVLLMSFFSVFCFSQNSPDTLPPLKKGQGYLVLDIDASGVAPSMRYAKLSSYSALQERELKLKHIDGKLAFIPLGSGHYQITSVSSPYFDLPFRLDTTANKHWQFVIKKGKLNYLGRISIDKTRGQRYINVDLKNRISYHLPHLQTQYHLALEKYPLRLAGAFQDDFLLDYLQ